MSSRGVRFEISDGKVMVSSGSIHDLMCSRGFVHGRYTDWKRSVVKRYDLTTEPSNIPIMEDGRIIGKSTDSLFYISGTLQLCNGEEKRKPLQADFWRTIRRDLVLMDRSLNTWERNEPKPTPETAHEPEPVQDKGNGKKSVLDLCQADLDEIQRISKGVSELAVLGLDDETRKMITKNLVSKKLGIDL